MSTLLRPLSTSELLDRTFFLYRNHLIVFAGITAIADLPVLALRLGNAALIAAQIYPSRLATLMVLLAAKLVALGVSHAGTVIAVSDVHLDRNTSIRSAYAVARKSLLRVIWISIIVTIAIPFFIAFVGGFLVALILIPMSIGRVGAMPVATGVVFLVGIIAAWYWWLARALVVPITMLEGTGLVDSMSRSKVLTEGRRGRGFIVSLLVVTLTYAITLLFQSPAYATGGLHFASGHLIASVWSSILLSIGEFAGTTLAGPLLTIALTLMYYDARVRKEGFDLELMMATLAPATEPAPAEPTAV